MTNLIKGDNRTVLYDIKGGYTIEYHDGFFKAMNKLISHIYNLLNASIGRYSILNSENLEAKIISLFNTDDKLIELTARQTKITALLSYKILVETYGVEHHKPIKFINDAIERGVATKDNFKNYEQMIFTYYNNPSSMAFNCLMFKTGCILPVFYKKFIDETEDNVKIEDYLKKHRIVILSEFAFKDKPFRYEKRLDPFVHGFKKCQETNIFYNETRDNFIDVGHKQFHLVDYSENNNEVNFYYAIGIPPKFFKIKVDPRKRIPQIERMLNLKEDKCDYMYIMRVFNGSTTGDHYPIKLEEAIFNEIISKSVQDVEYNTTQNINILLFENGHANAIHSLKVGDPVICKGKMRYNEQYNDFSIIPFSDNDIICGTSNGSQLNLHLITPDQVLNTSGDYITNIRGTITDIKDIKTGKRVLISRPCHDPNGIINSGNDIPVSQPDVSVESVPQFRAPRI